MESSLINLKVLLPFRVFAEIEEVRRITLETGAGSYGLLPQRLDGVAAISPGIFMYETARDGCKYLALDEGIMVKTGRQVLVSVRNAIGGTDLGKLHEWMEKEFRGLDEKEKEMRSVMGKLETGLLRNLEKLTRD
ncbi:MAG: F0F1 ATP synthase subunit epsilon [Puia sp.]|nr:F0F1 ATP synthase subunit epsilon [Puia sp.]